MVFAGEPTLRIVEAVIGQSRPGGVAFDYLRKNAVWEGGMRRSFSVLVGALAGEEHDSLSLAQERLQYLNGKYMTRYPLLYLRKAAEVIVCYVRERDWWAANPPRLMESTDEQAAVLAESISEILRRIHKTGCSRPYSLLTKYLHFCFPDSFPIYDAQAALSIQMWSYLAYDNRGPEWQPFQFARIADTSGEGYHSIVRFYRRLWASSSHEQRSYLTMNSDYISEVIEGRVSVPDLVDKLLWSASGDPLPLGLMVRPDSSPND